MNKYMKQWMLAISLLLAPLSWASDEVVMPAESVQTINVNTADAEMLSEQLDGVGLSKAQAIVAYREKNGDFIALDELTAVRGIGEKTLMKNAERIRLE